MVDKNDTRRGVELEFNDDVTRTIRPLSIRQLRQFVKILDKLGSTSDAMGMSDGEIDTMVDAAAIILEKVDPKLAADRDALEDVIDIVIFNELMSIAMGTADSDE